MNTTPKHPEITVQLTGIDGNAFSIIGLVRRALRRAGVSADEIQEFVEEATSGDYDNVFITAMNWVEAD